jgi:Zn-dependent peptidase ImmA (M78 family)/DNA-binding XRE family transcriptional regulator
MGHLRMQNKPTTVSNIGLVIETARRAQGLTQAQLSQAIGVTQAALCRYERGMREPEGEILERLAVALNVTPAFLHESSKIRGAVAVEAHMRRRKTAKPSDWKRLEARLNMHRLHARRVFDEISVRAEQRIPSFDPLEVNAASAALFLRMQWRMPSGPVRALTQWAEAAGCVLIQEDFGTAGVDGLSHWIDEVPLILLNVTAPPDRMRLTMAHELGHLCLHSQDVTEDMEQEANAFGAEFLMPAEAIRPELRNLTLGKLLDLKREWHVSVQALIERAWELKAISAVQRTRFYKALSAQGWRSREPLSDEIPAEVPSLPQEIGSALASGGMSPSEIAELAGFSRPDPSNPYLPRPKLRAL